MLENLSLPAPCPIKEICRYQETMSFCFVNYKDCAAYKLNISSEQHAKKIGQCLKRITDNIEKNFQI